MQAWFLHICRNKAVDHIRRGIRARGVAFEHHVRWISIPAQSPR